MDKSTQYKIFNDPIHGFITIPKGIILDLIDHPYIQRLRRIKQMGLGYLVFPAAEHSRFTHALGAMELAQRTLNNLREKDTTISPAEYEGTLIAVLLHDIGHGPLSHTLEFNLIKDFHHEMMTLAVMRKLNKEMNGALDMAIKIFTDQYPKKPFLNQLISSQLDIDRLDYLKRDSVFTSVYEGSVGIERILKTMRVYKGNIVIEKKGIYAIENYILARRLMYMQVYLHKTVLSADKLLHQIFRRVRMLIDDNEKLYHPSPALKYFLEKRPSAKKGISSTVLQKYLQLDDNDIYQSIKYWQHSNDPILSDLCQRFQSRALFRTTFLEKNPSNNLKGVVREKTKKVLKERNLPYSDEATKYYFSFDKSYSEAYRYENEGIWILEEKDKAVEFSKAADTQNIIALTEPVIKPYVVHLKSIEV
ncbi:HD domain-containing protein [Aliifodinibius salicampi]|uniref:HD domain-containing protein n=1 Tax=Fodinibius salicampi TaxID=1920655 RepID=A0ABT3PUZ2_9BACT|nr:HD domain-containing protein [Fodinibius salicampi]MCW9711653.1 HD domain-containing protein [Fodinibius salicampi]